MIIKWLFPSISYTTLKQNTQLLNWWNGRKIRIWNKLFKNSELSINICKCKKERYWQRTSDEVSLHGGQDGGVDVPRETFPHHVLQQAASVT